MSLTEEERKERKRAYAKRRYALNSEKEKERTRKWRLANPEKSKAIHAKSKAKHRDKILAQARVYDKKRRQENPNRFKEYYGENCERLRAKMRDYTSRNRDTLKAKKKNVRDSLGDSYVKDKIARGTYLQYKDIPQSLIRAKRAYIKGIRLIKEQENEGQKDQECR